jgi:hypothetical protein
MLHWFVEASGWPNVLKASPAKELAQSVAKDMAGWAAKWDTEKSLAQSMAGRTCSLAEVEDMAANTDKLREEFIEVCGVAKRVIKPAAKAKSVPKKAKT